MATQLTLNDGSLNSAGSLLLKTNGTTTAVTIDTSQNMGLGVTPSAWQSIRKAIQVGDTSSLVYGNNQTTLGNNVYINSSGQNTYIKTGAYAQMYIHGSGGEHIWFNAPSGTAGNAITFTQAMTLDASGNLGVGTTTPDVFGTGYERNASVVGTGTTSAINVSGATASRIQLGVGSTRYGYIYQDASNFLQIATTTALPIAFNTNGSERARITSSGFFKASNTGSYIGSTSDYHELNTTLADWSLRTRNSHASDPYGVRMAYTAAAPNNTANSFLFCADSSALRVELRSNGGLANYSANNVNLSDERTKTNIQDAGSYLAKICAIPVRTFKYKDQTDDLLNLGVIAQEVEAVAPELVDVAGFGETPEDGVPLKAIYQTDLQYALMKALQELNAKFEAYKAAHP